MYVRGGFHLTLPYLIIPKRYVCTPQGNAFLRNIAHTSEWIKQSEFQSIHVLYDDAAKHYEYFGKDAIEEETVNGHGPEVQETETGRRKEEKEGGK
eukprot:6213714-Pleurochrysis_carterae.AAC.2